MADFLFVPESGGKIPLYEQIYRYVVAEIQAGRLKEGDKLPSKRALCAQMAVSQATVEGAYGLLCAEGYIRALPRSGYRVCPYRPLGELRPAAPSRSPAPEAEQDRKSVV